MRISNGAALVALAIISACSREPDNGVIAAEEAAQVRDAAADGRIWCALAGDADFQLNCSMDRMASADGPILILGRSDKGYRRFRITQDGRGVVAADGAEAAQVRILTGGLIEVAVAGDRYRLPARVGSAQ